MGEVCEKLRRHVSEAVGEEEKLAACAALTGHVHEAQRESDFYRQKTVEAKGEWDKNAPHGVRLFVHAQMP